MSTKSILVAKESMLVQYHILGDHKRLHAQEWPCTSHATASETFQVGGLTCAASSLVIVATTTELASLPQPRIVHRFQISETRRPEAAKATSCHASFIPSADEGGAKGQFNHAVARTRRYVLNIIGRKRGWREHLPFC